MRVSTFSGMWVAHLVINNGHGHTGKGTVRVKSTQRPNIGMAINLARNEQIPAYPFFYLVTYFSTYLPTQKKKKARFDKAHVRVYIIVHIVRVPRNMGVQRWKKSS